MEQLNEVALKQQALGKDLTKILNEITKPNVTRQKLKIAQTELDAVWQNIRENDERIRELNIPTHKYHKEDYYTKLRNKYEEVLHKLATGIIDPSPSTEESTHETSPVIIGYNNLVSNFIELLDQAKQVATITQDEADMWINQIDQHWAEVSKKKLSLLDANLSINTTNHNNLFFKIIEVKKHIRNNIAQVQTVAGPSRLNPTIPAKTIPTYEGGYDKWANFQELFEQIIHNNSTISSIEKLEYLKGYVRGEAAQLINHLPMTGANYTTAWETLKRRYDNKRLLIAQLVDKFMDQPTCNANSPGQLKSLHDTTREYIQVFQNLGYETESWDPMVGRIVMRKWDNETNKIFDQYVESPHEVPDLETILTFLEKRFLSLEQNRSTRTLDTTTKKRTCGMCQSIHHDILRCPTFLSRNTQEKNRIVKEKNLCRNCLMHSSSQQCYSSLRCRVCNGYHHTQLHLEQPKQQRQGDPRRTQTTQYKQNRTYQQRSSNAYNTEVIESEDILPTALVKIVTSQGTTITARVLIDQCSQGSFITEQTAQALGLPREKVQNTINGLGGTTSQTSKSRIQAVLTPINSEEFTLVTQLYVLPKVTSQHPTKQIPDIIANQFKPFDLADNTFNHPGKIDILLGTKYYGQILRSGMVKRNGYLLQETEFGWIVSGGKQTERSPVVCMITKTHENDLSKFWEMEELPPTRPLTAEEELCEEIYNQTTLRGADGRYTVQLPFITRPPALGQSRDRALARFMQLEQKLQKNTQLYQEYRDFMEEYLELGHMKTLRTTEQHKPGYYIPHHAVFKTDSTTTKLRVVFDASCKTSSNNSLNDTMYAGPQLQNDITGILLRWRLHKIVFTADIEKMYRQIQVHEEDQHFQRIFWRFHRAEKIKEYKLCTVTYGTKAAPYLAIRTINQLAVDEGTDNPAVSQILRNDTYVDDVLSGANDIPTAVKLQANLIHILKKGGFNLRKWCSNNNNVLSSLPVELIDQTNFEITCPDKKSLGVIWDPIQDTFSFKLPKMQQKEATKRIILSDISKIFDPLGWLAPVVIKAKMLIQQLWMIGVSWDDPVSAPHQKEWKKLTDDLVHIERLKIPRWTYYSNELELHGYCDASEKAYGAVVYSRIVTNGQAVITLLQAKSKVAPIKNKITLPRLELCAAHLLTKLLTKVRTDLTCKILAMHAWTDSTITEAWIKGVNKKLDTFVANRVYEIQRLSTHISWHHVRSQENPADFISRGMEPRKLVEEPLWWKGPEWLSKRTEIWHKTLTSPITNIQTSTYLTQTNTCDLVTNFSSLLRLVRVLAYCRRFINKNRGHLTTEEIEEALHKLIKTVQEKTYQEEYKKLISKQPVPKGSRIKSLNPIMDKQNILRVGGRLERAVMSYGQKHPIILPANHHLSKLIVIDAHKSTLHGGIETTMAYIRRKYWIPNIKRMVRKHIHECVTCIRYKATVSQQIMGQLPEERITPSRAFTHTGVDYAGPIDVRTTKGRGHKTYKGYIALFVCLATKAIHLELASDMSTAIFLAAFRRFTSRRGRPCQIFSDNGKNFVGAEKQLRKEIKEMEESSAVQNEITQHGIQWKFIPALSPHFGGLWEAGVKSTKHHLRRILGNTTLTFEELSTVLCQIEACLNSRPLCGISNDSDELLALTPGHFLIGQAYIEPINIIDTPINGNLHLRWREIEKMKKDFWRVWSSEYLTRLQNMYKWNEEENNLAVDQVVIMKEGNINPANWKLARIEETHPGKDGNVRVVTVKSAQGTSYKRAITNLIPLPHHNTDDMKQKVTTTSYLTTSQHKKRHVQQPVSPHWVLLLLLGLFTTATATFQLKEVPKGILVEKLGYAYLKQGSFRMQVIYDKASIREQFRTMKTLNLQFKLACEAASAHNHTVECNYMQNQLHTNVQNLQYLQNYLEETEVLSTQKRHQRGILGTALTAIFGVNDEVYHEIDNLDENQQKLIKQNSHVETVMLSTLHAVSSTEQRLTTHFQGFQNQVNMAMEIVGNITKTNFLQLHLMNMFEQAKSYVVDFEDHYKKLQFIEAEKSAFLEIVPPVQVAQAINKSNALPAHLVIRTTTIEKAMIIKNRTHITAVGHFPIINTTPYELMELTSTAFNVTKEDYLTLDTTSGIIGVNYNLQQYFRLSMKEVNICQHIKENSHICSPPPIEKLDVRRNCAIEAVHQNNEPCPHKIIKHSLSSLIWKRMRTPNTWMFVTNQPKTVAVICSGERTNVLLQGTGMLQISDRCYIDSKEHRLFPSQDRNAVVHGLAVQPVHLTEYNLENRDPIQQEKVYSPSNTFQNILAQEIKYMDEVNQKTTWHTIPHHVNTYAWVITAFIFTAFSIGGTFWYIRRIRKPTKVTSIDLEDP